MSLANMVRTIKQIHPEDVVLIKIGVFYHAYGKDAYIIRCKEQKKARSHILAFLLYLSNNFMISYFSKNIFFPLTK